MDSWTLGLQHPLCSFCLSRNDILYLTRLNSLGLAWTCLDSLGHAWASTSNMFLLLVQERYSLFNSLGLARTRLGFNIQYVLFACLGTIFFIQLAWTPNSNQFEGYNPRIYYLFSPPPGGREEGRYLENRFYNSEELKP